MTNNSTNKIIIKALTDTHQNAKDAYIKALKQTSNTEQREQIKRIYKALTNKNI